MTQVFMICQYCNKSVKEDLFDKHLCLEMEQARALLGVRRVEFWLNGAKVDTLDFLDKHEKSDA